MSDSLRAGIVSILSTYGQPVGTGFVVTEDGLIATCAHVVEGAGAEPGMEVAVRFYRGGQELSGCAIETWKKRASWWPACNNNRRASCQLANQLAVATVGQVVNLPTNLLPRNCKRGQNPRSSSFLP